MVIITGGVGGIGSATVRLFAVEGAKLVIVDVNENEGEALASELKDDGLRWTPSVGQDWGEIKRGSRRSYAVYQCCVW